MGAHRIVAHPQTLTGSIGVIFAKINLMQLYSKLGITAEKLQYGDGHDWNLNPRDLANLSKHLWSAYERPLNWQTVSIRAGEVRRPGVEAEEFGQLPRIDPGILWTFLLQVGSDRVRSGSFVFQAVQFVYQSRFSILHRSLGLFFVWIVPLRCLLMSAILNTPMPHAGRADCSADLSGFASWA